MSDWLYQTGFVLMDASWWQTMAWPVLWILLKIVGVGQVVHAGQQCPELATVVHDATNGNPAKANAIIAALPPD